jgi:hypothetical protein
MKRFIIFYSTSNHCDSVVVDAESLDDAYETSQAFSRAHAVTVLGVFSQSHYCLLHSHSYE